MVVGGSEGGGCLFRCVERSDRRLGLWEGRGGDRSQVIAMQEFCVPMYVSRPKKIPKSLSQDR